MTLSTDSNTAKKTPASPPQQPKVAMLVTCLVDTMRPSVGFATLTLLEAAGCIVDVPSQTCCGQPAFNAGARQESQALAKQLITQFAEYDYVVAPSGSCIGMLHHYPELFPKDSQEHKMAVHLASKAWEITAFLTDVMQFKPTSGSTQLQVTYHDSCAGLRELGIHDEPRQLLAKMANINLIEMQEAQTCCGFGGLFCVKYPDISNRMVSNKISAAESTQAQMLLAGDLGCLLNMAGKLKRQGSNMQVRHIVEVLADQLSHAAIAEADNTAIRFPKADLGYEA